MKRLNNILLILSVFLLMSCTKDWLKPDAKSFLTPENTYINKEGFESSLVTMRKNLKIETTGQMHNLVMDFAASDLGSPWSQLDFYNLTPNTDQYYRFLAMFTDAFKNIKDANVLISRIDNITWSVESDRNALLSEALWHRAFWYYRLVNSFGDVPFINGEITGAKLDFFSHSRWTILDKIQADLEYAVQWLPETAGPGVITKGAGNQLLAKVYLANLQFDKAITASSSIINGPYALMKDRFGSWQDDPRRNVIWDLHRPENMSIPENTETILTTIDRFEAPSDAKSEGLYTMRMFNCQWFQAAVLDSQGKTGMVASGAEYDSLGRGNANVRLTWFYQYGLWNFMGDKWDNTSDLRRSDINWVDINEIKYNNPSSVNYGETVNSAWFASPADTFKYLYAMPHYIMYVPSHDPQERPFGSNGDWYIYRLAETYLIRAEAHFWKNELQLAADDINTVRERANALPVTASDVSLDLIFDERARELFAEEQRHSELVRASYILAKSNLQGYSLATFSENNYYYDRVMKYNTAYTTGVFLLGNLARIAPFHVLWPIPSSVITANTLGTINQNEGYQGSENNVPPLTTIE
jgi:starch-binding outer membrane protein, SusD/RagB family